MSVINTNSLSLIAQGNLSKSQSALGTAIERLSSGMRINSAKDDAAGQAIANRFTANIRGLTQATRNANDGISIAQTTEGSLNEINTNLQRIRELSVQAANGSNSGTDLESIQAEITQRLEEIDRVSQQTQFNGKKVLSAEAGALNVQVGSNDSETIQINLREISSTTLGLGNLNVQNTAVDTKELSQATLIGEPVSGTGSSVALTGSGANAVKAASVVSVGVTGTVIIDEKIDTNPSPTYAIYVNTSDASKLSVSADGGTTFYDVTEYDATTNSVKYNTSAVSGTETNANTTAAAGNDILVDGTAGTYMAADNIVGRIDANPAAAVTVHLDSDGQLFVEIGAASGVYQKAEIDLDTGNVSFNSADLVYVPTVTPAPGDEVKVYATEEVAVKFKSSDEATVGTSPTLHQRGDGAGHAVKGNVGGDDVFYSATFNSQTGVVTLGGEIDDVVIADLSTLDAGVVGTGATLINMKDGTQAVKGQLGGDDVYHSVTVAAGGAVTLGAKIDSTSDANLSTLDATVVGAGATLINMKDGTQAVKGQLGGDDVYHSVTVAAGGAVTLGAKIESTSNANLSTLDATVVGTGAALVNLQGGGLAVKGQLNGTDVIHSVTVDTAGVVTLGDKIEDTSIADLSTLDASKVGTDATLHTQKDGSHVVKGTANGADIYYAATVEADGKVTLGKELNGSPLASIDNALSKVDALRSELGAIQNRFQSTIANLSNTVNNLSAARSRIEDADYAVEVSNMTRAQILQQAGTSVLAQANQVPQTVLSLLR